MVKAIESSRNGFIVGHVMLGMWGKKRGSPKREVHDGDTIIVQAPGNIGVRFLGIDTPEISYPLPGSSGFPKTSSANWISFLTDPFDAKWGNMKSPLYPGLKAHLENCINAGAINHHKLAKIAEEKLEDMVIKDIADLNQTKNTFNFFLRFSHEIMDRYGRFLCFINRDQPDANNPSPRPNSYNERLLEIGWGSPYFIWPNINPFAVGSLIDNVPPPNGQNTFADSDPKLRTARQWVQHARSNQIGLYDPNDPLNLEPFELRFLARRTPPNRWVIDLNANNDVLIQPQKYYTIPNPEDRLFIPEEYVPLFVENGWKRYW